MPPTSLPAGTNAPETARAPPGELAGDLFVTVGAWPGTYPLKGRIHTTGPVELRDLTHARRDRASEFCATVPIAGTKYQALCELP